MTENRDPHIYETEIKDEEGLVWLVRHTIGIGQESPGLPVTSKAEFVRPGEHFVGRVEGVNPATKEEYRAALEDAKRLDTREGTGF